MKKLWIIILIIATGFLSVLITRSYFQTKAICTNKTFVGTYQFNGPAFDQSDDDSVINYLAVVYPNEETEGEFSIYDPLNGVIKKGTCQLNSDYLSLKADPDTFLLSYINNKYYFISDDQPEIIDKISNSAIE